MHSRGPMILLHAQTLPPPPPPISKLDRRHTERLVKSDSLLPGRGWAISRITGPQESLVHCKSFNTLLDPIVAFFHHEVQYALL
jgi:hypothetical protein